jgi:hypothetical protein
MMHCPRCNNYTFRIKRKQSDRLIDILTFGVFAIKRFKCFYCYWEGRITRSGHEIKLGQRIDERVKTKA